MHVYAVGIDHHLAPLAVRERVALDPAGAAQVTRAVAGLPWVGEALVLSTCNRTELYVASAAPEAAELALAAFVRHVPAAPPPDHGVYRLLAHEAAARHLLRVAAGLESAILGETEIQGQVRAAHERGRAEGGLGPVLDRLFQAALRAGRRARAETRISDGSVSHGHAAAQVVQRVFERLDGHRVLLVGAGEVAQQVGRALLCLGPARLAVANRTPEHAHELAAALGAERTLPLAEVPEELAHAHVVLLAAGPNLIGRPDLERALRRRRDPLLLVDLGVPRCVDPSANELPGVFLYDLGALERLVAAALGARRAAVPDVERILQEELAPWLAWQRGLGALPAIRTLAQWAEEVRRAELAFLPADLDPALREAVERLTERLVNRLLGRATARVVQGARADDPSLPTADQLERVFGLREEAGP